MENAVDALKMAFAVIVLMMALSVSIISFNNVKNVSDIVLYSKDETNYYEYQGAIGKAAENRIVGLETIIPTLYKYYKENYTVVFRSAKYDFDTGTFSNVEPLPLYTTSSRYRSGKNESSGSYLWGKKVGDSLEYSTYDLLMYKKYNKHTYDANGDEIVSASIFKDVYDAIGNSKGNKQIFSFDLEEETLRHEPWTGSYDKAHENLRCFLNGEDYINPNDNTTTYIDYSNSSELPKIGGFIGNYKNEKFVETIGEYVYSSSQANSNDTEDEDGELIQEGSTINSLVKAKKKRIIIFTLINNYEEE